MAQPPSVPVAEPLAQTEAEETKSMDQTIANFLNNQPASAPQETAAPSEPIQTPNQISNDQTLAQAVNDLMSPTDLPQTPNSSIVNQTSEGQLATSNDNSLNGSGLNSTNNSAAINGKKIIRPVDSQPTKSLDELLAQEAAADTITQASANQPNINSRPFDPTDPNNIAL